LFKVEGSDFRVQYIQQGDSTDRLCSEFTLKNPDLFLPCDYWDQAVKLCDKSCVEFREYTKPIDFPKANEPEWISLYAVGIESLVGIKIANWQRINQLKNYGVSVKVIKDKRYVRKDQAHIVREVMFMLSCHFSEAEVWDRLVKKYNWTKKKRLSA